MLTADEAAALLGISERTLRKLRQRGEIRYIAISDRIIRYFEEDCEAFLQAKRRTDTPCPSRSRTNVRLTGNMTSKGAGGGFMARRERLINERRKPI
jgi:excisionase family DNA binding protein